MLSQKRILVGISGGIAAYKVCEVISQLFQAGAEVRVILTETAQQFITPLTVATLSRHQAYTDQDFWQPLYRRPLHIELGEWAEMFLIAPLTAQTLAKLAYGMADNLLTNTVLASRCPILLAPAMNTEMWEQAAVQRNWQLLTQDPRYLSVGPGAGLLACDRVGSGRLAEPIAIVKALESLSFTQGKQDLQGKTLLISAGGTREYLDPVRFIGNPSTGKMGLAIAQAALDRGASVILVHGPLSEITIPASERLQRIPVVSAAQMEKSLIQQLPQADYVLMAAAVADVKPAHYSSDKLPKKALPPALELQSVTDIVARLSQLKQPHQILVGFAAQTGDIIPPAREKLQRKGLDLIVANPIDRDNAGFGSDTNEAVFLDKHGQQQRINSCRKLELAHRLLSFMTDYRRDDPSQTPKSS
ncbi:MAG: bifunctional phosphopantothenoylcysteine decarboxylase/phosphopantothenate--cysteine ligase CoaBC [Snowella sp.]|nr:bifunctional phosphopantothenoylcysteine decarboxylase/phosphopantothenate--cysteine ligase CoaBC [Snowella sp.]